MKRNVGDAVPLVTDIEVSVLERIGDLASAEEELGRLIRIEPRRYSHEVKLANIKFRQGEAAAAKEVIESIDYEEIKDDAEALMEVATDLPPKNWSRCNVSPGPERKGGKDGKEEAYSRADHQQAQRGGGGHIGR